MIQEKLEKSKITRPLPFANPKPGKQTGYKTTYLFEYLEIMRGFPQALYMVILRERSIIARTKPKEQIQVGLQTHIGIARGLPVVPLICSGLRREMVTALRPAGPISTINTLWHALTA